MLGPVTGTDEMAFEPPLTPAMTPCSSRISLSERPSCSRICRISSRARARARSFSVAVSSRGSRCFSFPPGRVAPDELETGKSARPFAAPAAAGATGCVLQRRPARARLRLDEHAAEEHPARARAPAATRRRACGWRYRGGQDSDSDSETARAGGPVLRVLCRSTRSVHAMAEACALSADEALVRCARARGRFLPRGLVLTSVARARVVPRRALIKSPRSIAITNDENRILRIPDSGMMFQQQRHLQDMLVDIHTDPGGFKRHIEGMRTTMKSNATAISSPVDVHTGCRDDYEMHQAVGATPRARARLRAARARRGRAPSHNAPRRARHLSRPRAGKAGFRPSSTRERRRPARRAR